VKALRHAVCLLMIGSGFVLVQGVSAASTTPELAQPKTAAAKADTSLLQQLRNQARGSVTVEREPATNRAGFITVGRNGDLMPGNSARAVDKAAAFLGKYGALLGATDTRQLVQTGRQTDKYGTTVTYTQRYRGIPVFGGTVLAHLDDAGDLTTVNGTAVPNLSLSTTPELSKSQIGARAVRYVKSDPPTSDTGKAASTTGIRASNTQLMVYRTGLVRGAPGPTYLAYRIEVSNGTNIRDIVFMHAGSGKVLNRYSMVDNALERHVYEKDYDPTKEVWKEGDPFPGSLTEDQQNIVQASGESYWFFKNSFDQDSYDNQGAPMRTVNNDPRISCPNANWNGTTTNYCNGVTADDVVAHEWGHAYTEYNHNLIYQYQPGALNESYSDIWGETVDLINNRMDDDETNQKRGDNQCSTNTPSKPVVVINTPQSIARVCPAGGASFGKQLDGIGVTDDVVLGKDIDEDGAGTVSTNTDACSAITNTTEVDGKIVIVDRGGCAFTQKATNVDATNAVGLIIGNNVPGPPNSMSGDVPVSIPVVQISQDNRNAIVSQLANGVNVTMKDAGGNREDSFRWLIGEDATAFGGAIRDMWTPTCLGDPGKVSDAEYYCGTADGGGVHSNSGVPNHGYALLVDGGTYNGKTVPGIGLTRAAHIYWRAESVYQTPTTDFADHADALSAACTDLVGKTVVGLSTKGSPEDKNSPPPGPSRLITAATCTSVNAMADAVELRKDPTQCNYQPLLTKNAPGVCSGNQKRNVVWYDNFENGLGNWDVTSSNVYGGPTFPWRADRTLPADRNGTAAYAADPTSGSCNADTNDNSSVTSMTTEPILIPGSKQKSPRVTFNHYVATEAGYDGGNLKVRVNSEGPFEVVPKSAYIFNPPTTLATEAAGNTNPLAGQDGFTGTDGGSVRGSWGRSQVDLTMIGARSGDSVELRFDFGQDGCNGNDGWYVDDVTVSTCKAGTKTTATQDPRPSRFGNAPKVRVDVDSLGGQGEPTGQVVVREGNRKMGSGTLNNNGRVRITLPQFMGVGTHSLVARYRGSDLHSPSADQFTVRVVKAAPDIRLELKPDPVLQGRRLNARISTPAYGFTPNSQVRLIYRGEVIGRTLMQNGVANIFYDRKLPLGKVTMKAVYVGTDRAQRSVDYASTHVFKRQ